MEYSTKAKPLGLDESPFLVLEVLPSFRVCEQRKLISPLSAVHSHVPQNTIPGAVDMKLDPVIVLAGRVGEEHDRSLQALDLVKVHDAHMGSLS